MFLKVPLYSRLHDPDDAVLSKFEDLTLLFMFFSDESRVLVFSQAHSCQTLSDLGY